MPITKEERISSVISKVQKILLLIFLSVLPISIMPFPWDYTEKGMTIVILFFTLLIVGLELIKTVWTGKIYFIRRDIDIVLFSLLVSLLLTTIFATDTNLSLFGYDYRLGPGFVSLGASMFLLFVIRSFIINKRDLLLIFNAFLLGSILTSILSIFSFMGLHILQLIPKLSNLGITGYPIIGIPAILVTYNCIAILLAYITLSIYNKKDNSIKLNFSWFSIFVIVINIISLVLFSTNVTALYIVALFLVVWIISLIIIFFKDNEMSSQSKLLTLVVPVIMLLSVILMQINSFREIILSDRNVVTPLKLSLDFSWQIVSQSLTQSLKSAIFGLGLDNFGVVFTALKPLDLVNLNFLSSYNEVLTSLSNGGFLWLVIWFVLGWYIVKDLIKDLKQYSSNNKIVIYFNILILFIYLVSFLSTYSVILRLIFFLFISFSIILRKIYINEDVDSSIFKIWSMGVGAKQNAKDLSITGIFLTLIISIVMIIGIVRLGSITISSLYLLRAESYASETNIELQDREPSLEEKKTIVNNFYRWYRKALDYDAKNPLVNRKLSAAALDRLGILVQEYENTEDENILTEVVNLRIEAFEYSRNAINFLPTVYLNYNNRVKIYLSVINLGYTEYIRDTIAVINEAIFRNPYDYENYYNKGQLYYYLQNYEQALEASNQALSIKGDYIPALILSANVNGIEGNTEIQLSYLNALKTILETNQLEESQLYKDLLEQIDLISDTGQPLEENGMNNGEDSEEEQSIEEIQEDTAIIEENSIDELDIEDVPETEQ
jgi:tetratricopeptide (TPR) repeat protein